MALRWGIVSSGSDMSHDFCYALGTLSDLDHEIVAISAGNLKLAQAFADAHHIQHAYGDYVQLAENPDVEVVFVAKGNNVAQYEMVRLMLEKGKHVLLEKTILRDTEELRKLIMYAQRKKLSLVEGIWTRFFPSYQYLRCMIRFEALGAIQRVDIEVGCDLGNENSIEKIPFGTPRNIQEISMIGIQLCEWIFQLPPGSVKVTADGLDVEGSPLSMTAELSYGDNESATIRTSSVADLKNTATIIGTTGKMKIENLLCPTTLIDFDGKPKTWPLPESSAPFSDPAAIGLCYAAEQVRQGIRHNHRSQTSSMKHNDSLNIAYIEDDIFRHLPLAFE